MNDVFTSAKACNSGIIFFLLVILFPNQLKSQFRSGPTFYNVMEGRQNWFFGLRYKAKNGLKNEVASLQESSMFAITVKRRIIGQLLVSSNFGFSQDDSNSTHFGILLEQLQNTPSSKEPAVSTLRCR